MKRQPYYEFQASHPFRSPSWRWDRALDLIETRRYYSRKRDDVGTGIAMSYLRELAKCASDQRLRRVRRRFQFVDTARAEYEGMHGRRLELETRILARQSDQAIGFEMALPSPAVQAYRDLFFHVDDRINATSFILFHVIGLPPDQLPFPVKLMQMSAYLHGPEVIEPWLGYLRDEWDRTSLETQADREMASIDLFVASQMLPPTSENNLSLLKNASILLTNDLKCSKSVSGREGFLESTAQIMGDLAFPCVKQAPFSYAPSDEKLPDRANITKKRHNREAA